MRVITKIAFVFLFCFSLSGFSQTLAEANAAGKALADSINSGVVNNSAQTLDPTTIPNYTTNPTETQYYGSGLGIEDQALTTSITDPNAQFIQDAKVTRPDFTLDKATDPLFAREDEIARLANSVTDTGYTNCVDLPVGGATSPNSTTDSCNVMGAVDVTNFDCQRSIISHCKEPFGGEPYPYGLHEFDITGNDFSPVNIVADKVTSGSWWNDRSPQVCTLYNRTFTFNIEDISDITQFTFDALRYDDVLNIYVNGIKVFGAVGGQQGLNLPQPGDPNPNWGNNSLEQEFVRCEYGGVFTGTPFDAINSIRTGLNVISVDLLVAGAGNYYTEFTIHRKWPCTMVIDDNVTDCPVGNEPLKSTLVQSVCNNLVCAYPPIDITNPDLKKAIMATDPIYVQPCTSFLGCNIISYDNGVVNFSYLLWWSVKYVSLDISAWLVANGYPKVCEPCASFTDSYVHESDPYFIEDPYCATLRSQGCYQTGSVCDVPDSRGFCASKTVNYQCDSLAADSTVQLCGAVLSCPDGNCATEYQAWVQDDAAFIKANTTAELMVDITKDMTTDANAGELISLFSGEGYNCQDTNWGFKNCCDASGWGLVIGATGCTPREEILGLAREAGRTHYIGSYTTGSFFLKKTYNVFCVYESKLGRIFTEQGNQQLGKTYGTPTAPDCSGFTTSEFQSLDLTAMDLSEFTQDILNELSNANFPALDTLVQDMQQNINNLTK